MEEIDFKSAFDGFLERFYDIGLKFLDDNSEWMATVCFKLIGVALEMLRWQIENQSTEEVSWDNPAAMVPIEVEFTEHLVPATARVTSEDFRNRKAVAEAVLRSIRWTRTCLFLMAVTRGVVIAKQGEEHTLYFPPEVIRELDDLRSKRKRHLERELVEPKPIPLGIDLRGKLDGKQIVTISASLEITFSPLYIDYDLGHAFYPIYISLRVSGGNPKTWTKELEGAFWDKTIELVKGRAPEDNVECLSELLDDARLVEVVIHELAGPEYADRLRDLGQSYLTYQAKQRELTGKFVPLEPAARPDSDAPVLSEKQKRDYRRYEYLRHDRIHIPGSDRKKRSNVVVVNGIEARVPDHIFPLFLRLVVELKRKEGGWVSPELLYEEGVAPMPPEYRPYQELRDALGRTLSRPVADQLIQNIGHGKYRISAHPDFITYDKGKLLEHPEEDVRKVVEQLPRLRTPKRNQPPR